MRNTLIGKFSLNVRVYCFDCLLIIRKQTVFYMKNFLAIKEGEKIEGMLKCKPNAKNPRDLDIEIDFKFDGQSSQLQESHQYKMC
jgi:type I protein arginine methyltransferase